MPASSTTPTPTAPRKAGGRRPGAGAPRGNLNALRTGTRSVPLARLYRAAPPAIRLHIAVAVEWATRAELAALPPQASGRERTLARTRAIVRVAAHLNTEDWALFRTEPELVRVTVRALAPLFAGSRLIEWQKRPADNQTIKSAHPSPSAAMERGRG